MRYVCPKCGYEGIREMSCKLLTETILNVTGKEEWEVIDAGDCADETVLKYECPNSCCLHVYQAFDIYSAIEEMAKEE